MFGFVISIVCLLVVVFIAWWFFAEHEKVSGHARQNQVIKKLKSKSWGAIRLKPLS